MAAQRPEHAHATDRPATATLPPRPAHTTTGWRQDRRPVVSKRPLHSLAAAKMSPHIHIGPEPVLAAHARSPPAAGSRCPAGADSAPHSEQNFSIVCGGQPSPHEPRLVVSHSTCPPLSSSPHAHSFVLGSAVINNNPYGARSARAKRTTYPSRWCCVYGSA
jgi:hypothetical protein